MQGNLRGLLPDGQPARRGDPSSASALWLRAELHQDWPWALEDKVGRDSGVIESWRWEGTLYALDGQMDLGLFRGANVGCVGEVSWMPV